MTVHAVLPVSPAMSNVVNHNQLIDVVNSNSETTQREVEEALATAAQNDDMMALERALDTARALNINSMIVRDAQESWALCK